MDYYDKPLEEVFKELGSSEKGLSESEAKKKLATCGLNELQEAKKISKLKILLSQFKSFIVWILIVAVVISLVLGDFLESVVILVIIVLNAIIGFVQEFRAERAIEALKRLSGLKADVFRNGAKKTIDAKELVPGDIMFLEVGDKIPADARIIEQSNLQTQESSLTGESTPVTKKVDVLKEAPLSERNNMVFSGTIITKGRAKAIVTATGMGTEIGRIATLIKETEEELTPLQVKLNKFAKRIGYIVIAIAILVFIATVMRGNPVLDMFKTAVSIAVAAIPESLPAVVALSLALGVQRMIKKNALVRKLPSVETLGSTTVICSDKTGTLTKDQMTVRKVYVGGAVAEVTGQGYSTEGSFSVEISDDLRLLLRIGALCNDAVVNKDHTIVGDPTEAALIVSAAKAGIIKENLEKKMPRVDEIQFDSERKRMTTVHKEGGKKVMYTKGAPDVILNLCTSILKNGKVKKLTAADRKLILGQNEEFANNALRVLGLAYKDLKANEKPDEKGLVFAGLQAMIDPPREEAKAAIDACKGAGIKVVMITGDHQMTAVAIAKELGIEGKAITGAELDKIKNLAEIVDDIAIYARVSPEHKIKIVEALKKKDHIAAMTGDGVNDAPALKRADIGIAMGKTGTDVAREASKMVLTDDNFTSIVNAVEEGRGIFDNIRKFTFSLLTGNVPEVLIIFLAVLIGLKLPLLAIQILWVNLLTDALPALALGLEPREKDIMQRKPRKKEASVVDKAMFLRVLVMSVFITVCTLGIYVWALYSQGWTWGAELPDDSPAYLYAITMAFTALVLFELFNTFNSKSETKNVFKVGFFSNKYLTWSVVLSVVLTVLVIHTSLNEAFHTVPLSIMDWAIIVGITFTVMVVDAIYKFFSSRRASAL
ncbi:calcium-translocating P-type ATPase, SERCA-type [Candidatus Woesearchaeota archaeon]|nr:calcium-translocating P-type ATPase, SERCA-type [Candidatus Woesearchaeota archaeon]